MNSTAINYSRSQWTTSKRRGVYASIAASFFVAAVLAAALKSATLKLPFDLAVSDGRFYYAYLPSLFLDHDLDFTNQVVERWGPDFSPDILEDRTETGRVRNKYPIGFALSVAPGFLLGHGIAVLSNGRIPANGYSWPYQAGCLACVELMVWQSLMLIDALLTMRLSVRPAATLAGVCAFAVATPYAYYAFREPFMVHAVSAYWCTALVASVANANGGPKWLWPRLSFFGAMAVVCRPTNAHLLPIALYGFGLGIRRFDWRLALRALPMTALGLTPIALQFWVWHALSSHWIYFSYRGESFDWRHPALWQTLFSSRHGLFFWTPILAFAILALFRRFRDPIVCLWLIGGCLLWYANSAWTTWWFGDAFGARAFLELAGLFAIGLGLLFERLSRRAAIVLMAMQLAQNSALMALYIAHRIPRGDYLWGQ